MNFWEAQSRAKSKTAIYVSIFVILTLLVALFSEWALRTFSPENYNPEFPFFGLFVLLIIFSVSGFQYSMFRLHGGSYVAESVGAWRIDPTTTHPQEKQLLNIVEEIAIASALPIPPVYLLDAKPINAFAAGLSPTTSAVTITTGALNTLSRDEIQGVIAHEFGHIYNGDMKISLRLAAMVMGFFFILYIGMRLLSIASNESRYRGRDDNGRSGNPVAIAAVVLLLAGAFTWVFGSILKASVSREREYLADACAVQFTRNPEGIANALRKIMYEQETLMPERGIAYSHLYLDNHTGINSLFATHPPLTKRIEAIEGRLYMPEEWKEDLEKVSKEAARTRQETSLRR